ncbi:MAG: BON domain-containing protein [Rhodocyclaceae bacterium]|nr:BON domain-containing protein [Rhodocyclaceae bacterium]
MYICKSHVLAAVLCTSAALLVGCNQSEAPKSAGQQVDSAMDAGKKEVDKMERRLDKAGDAIEQKAAAAGQALDDTALTARVKAKILAADDLKTNDIAVETKNGVVTLTGTAATHAARDHATNLAMLVDGVVKVDNKLVVMQKSS